MGLNLITQKELIDHYKLIPHIEGGFYSRTYRSNITVPQSVLPNRFEGDRTLSSTILYLIPSNIKSKFHRLKSDEIWHFYLGDPFHLIELHQKDGIKETKMGNQSIDYKIQHLIPHNSWFGGYVDPEGLYSYSLMGCTLFPGFDDHDFELADKEELISNFPLHKNILLDFF